ncbi:putative lipoyltransferase 2, mitochondrial [Oncorhynchus mykiss]|uniref:Octanoyl-[acyl-carrier-protein]:protein N-octanoyltransferase LIPT2, mitochondrial n=1 Tax=Oncorhynchus mykiss TaxID=8022 RepID=A0A8C7SD99_ONCMY|nr:putative lipoyltransferase 2, mitochondrial [Oncorhynchus mykiss]
MHTSTSAAEVIQLGRISYARALQVQQLYVRRHLDSKDKLHNALLLCEHPPVYTIRTRHSPFEEEQRLKLLGAELFRSNRDGFITIHGPGELVCYPIINLGCFKKSVKWYVFELERTGINLFRKYVLKASSSPDTGVWVGNNKICAIGIHCGRYITLALNCNTDMGWFENIVPCGIVGKGVTSLSQELG